MNQDLRRAITECQRALAAGKGIDFAHQTTAGLTEFKKLQHEALRKTVFSSIDLLEKLVKQSPAVHNVFGSLREQPSLERLAALIELIDTEHDTESVSSAPPSLGISLKSIPDTVLPEIKADHEELKKCLAAGCFRSAIILCGRILETALHRKYFEVTGNDLLEKAPGIGLGSVIAKMSERGIALDPGLANQIHLINQVRVWSVHKKQTPFEPSEAQANAIMLYTLDVVGKLWD